MTTSEWDVRGGGVPLMAIAADPPGSDGSVENALAAIREGGIVVVVDDESREDEGDLIIAAEHATPEAMAFIIRHTSGFVCTAITSERADALDLPLMVANNTERQRTAFTVTVDYQHGATCGGSAVDRARTARALADRGTQPEHFERPGHMHVLRAEALGVLRRPGHTEAAVDLARMAGLAPAGVLCELVTADGVGMARGPEVRAFAAAHRLPLVRIDDLIRYRRRGERLVRRVGESVLPTEFGDFQAFRYEDVLAGTELVALVVNSLSAGPETTLLGVHKECLAGDVFGSRVCTCGRDLRASLCEVSQAHAGVVVYMRSSTSAGNAATGRPDAGAAWGPTTPVGAEGHESAELSEGERYAVAHVLRDLDIEDVRLVTRDDASNWQAVGVRVRPAALDSRSQTRILALGNRFAELEGELVLPA